MVTFFWACLMNVRLECQGVKHVSILRLLDTHVISVLVSVGLNIFKDEVTQAQANK